MFIYSNLTKYNVQIYTFGFASLSLSFTSPIRLLASWPSSKYEPTPTQTLLYFLRKFKFNVIMCLNLIKELNVLHLRICILNLVNISYLYFYQQMRDMNYQKSCNSMEDGRIFMQEEV